MKCAICGIEIGFIDDAISDDWLLLFMKEKSSMARYVAYARKQVSS